MATPSNKSRTRSLHDEAYALFVQALVEKRIKSGLSQQALADALGWNQSIVARVESVQRRLDIIELIHISKVIGFDPARFVREAERIVARQDRP